MFRIPVRRSTMVVLSGLLATIAIGACGDDPSTPSGGAAAEEARAAATTAAVTATPTPSPREDVALVCGDGEGASAWTSIPAEGEVRPVDIDTGCLSRETGVGGAGDDYAGIQRLSPDFQRLAGTVDAAGTACADDCSARHVAYLDLGGAMEEWVDVAGVDSGSFSRADVSDSDALFNPKDGRLWWVRDGDRLMSMDVDEPGSQQEEGSGSLYGFAGDGSPVPAPVYDSPSGRMRAVVTAGDGYSGDVAVGDATLLTGACLESSEITAATQLQDDDVCGARLVTRGEDQISCTGQFGDPNFSGWVDDDTIVCGVTAHDLDGGERRLVPETEQTIRDARVSPDGKTLIFIAEDDSRTVTVYRVPTDGSSADAEPEVVTVPVDRPSAIPGWMLADGTIQP